MRSLLLTTVCLVILGLSALLSAKQDDAVKVKVRLVDADTARPMSGILRVCRDGDDKPLTLPGLFDRLRGLEKSARLAGWYVVPADGAEVMLPRANLRLEALSGLETALAQQRLDLRSDSPKEVTIKLPFLFRPEKEQLVAGNTHLHLMKLTREESDDYLAKVPAADGLKVLFISYLERVKDDEFYITNRYPIGALKQFEATGVLYSNGEEHRHNFQGYGQGYGHVMLLGIQKLVKPVSIGPGIMGAGFDDTPLRPGIDDARRQGGTIIWCHNTNGWEDVPNALTGRLDALNVFDGSRTGKFEDHYYHYLNVGLRMPISTGTDWFMYDFSRVYARPTGKLTIASWLEAVKAGRCSATNGPLLSLTVNGKPMGDVIKLDKPASVRVEGSAVGRHDFQQLQLVHNGKVIEQQAAKQDGAGFAARLARDVRIDTPGWLALRINAQTQNELDKQLYAHTSPIYVDVEGRQVFDVESARVLLRQIEEGQSEIRARGKFSNPQALAQVLTVYEKAVEELTARINQRK